MCLSFIRTRNVARAYVRACYLMLFEILIYYECLYVDDIFKIFFGSILKVCLLITGMGILLETAYPQFF